MVMLGIIHTCTALWSKPTFIGMLGLECLTATQEILVRSSTGTKGDYHFFTCYTRTE